MLLVAIVMVINIDQVLVKCKLYWRKPCSMQAMPSNLGLIHLYQLMQKTNNAHLNYVRLAMGLTLVRNEIKIVHLWMCSSHRAQMLEFVATSRDVPVFKHHQLIRKSQNAIKLRKLFLLIVVLVCYPCYFGLKLMVFFVNAAEMICFGAVKANVARKLIEMSKCRLSHHLCSLYG